MISSAEEWDLVVPEDGAELLAEFRRHGVDPGQRVHLRAVPDLPASPWDDFIGSGVKFTDPDLSANAKRIVRDEMGK